MRISQLEIFVSAARNLSFTKAAKECFTVQSVVSQQITALESELGFSLFDRTQKGILLTPAGERYYSDTVLLLDQLKENRETAMQIAKGICGTLKVGLAGANQAPFLQGLKRFYHDNPTVKILFPNVNTEHQLEELRSGFYDILHTAVFTMQGLENEIGFSERRISKLMVYMNEEHPLARHENISLEELACWPNIYATNPENAESVSTSKTIFDGSGITPVRTIYVRNQNINSLMLDFNVGVSVAPEELLPSMPRNVVSRPLENGRFQIELGWAYLRSNTNPALQRLVNYLDNRKFR